MNIGIGLSIEKDPILAAREATRLASLNLHSQKIDLAIVFSSVDLASAGLGSQAALGQARFYVPEFSRELLELGIHELVGGVPKRAAQTLTCPGRRGTEV